MELWVHTGFVQKNMMPPINSFSFTVHILIILISEIIKGLTKLKKKALG